MAKQTWRVMVPPMRHVLERLAGSSERARRLMALAGRELSGAADRVLWHANAAGMYAGSYFGEGRDPSGDRGGLSGYATYDRVSSNADVSAYLIWRNFRGAKRVLDVGCAKGYLVEALRELGVDAEGCDVSEFAVEHPAEGARGHVRLGNLMEGLPWPDEAFDVLSVLETLEHLPPARVPEALRELRRVSRGFLYATIPSFGPSDGPGPAGFFDGKVLPARLDYYVSLGPDYDGPVPFEDLYRDSEGNPIEGHLTIASYRWWTRHFEEAGFLRRPDLEERIYRDIEPAGLAVAWNVYVMAAGSPDERIAEPRSPGKGLVELGLAHPLFA
ncbi:MAG: class I SAM-dependent methyltransferase [Acidimicrobiales bacterium]